MQFKHYDVTIEWVDSTKEDGYQLCLEDVVVGVSQDASLESIFEEARKSRPSVLSAQIQGPHNSSMAFQGSTFFWTANQ